MTADALEQILALVADGRLSAAEAAPILDALDRRASGEADRDRSTAPGGSASRSSKASADGAQGGAIRIEVSESGRNVVNLRVPLALGRDALSRIPGLSESLTDRVREALASGFKGSIVDVADGADGVRIIIE